MSRQLQRRVARTAGAALATVALLAPAAGARPTPEVVAVPGPADAPLVEPPAPTVTRTLDEGFDWGSAGAGAGAAIAVVLMSAAGLSLRGPRAER